MFDSPDALPSGAPESFHQAVRETDRTPNVVAALIRGGVHRCLSREEAVAFMRGVILTFPEADAAAQASAMRLLTRCEQALRWPGARRFSIVAPRSLPAVRMMFLSDDDQENPEPVTLIIAPTASDCARLEAGLLSQLGETSAGGAMPEGEMAMSFQESA